MRIQVNLSDEMVGRVDKIASMYGVTRSGLLATFIGQMVTQTESSHKYINNIFKCAPIGAR